MHGNTKNTGHGRSTEGLLTRYYYSHWANVVSRDEIRRIVLELIRTDEEFRLAIAGALGLDTILNELRALRQDFNALLSRAISIEETLRRHEEILQEHTRLLREHSKILEEHARMLQEHTRLLQDNDRMLREHGAKLDEHGKTL